MRILLDSHILVWVSEGSSRLPGSVIDMLGDPSIRFFFSSISLWELAIKSALNKPDYMVDVRQLHAELLENGYDELVLATPHVFALSALPQIHKDPFDRILIAQAISEQMLLLTSDAVLSRYGGPVRLAV